ncbi:MAG: hypothetical protein Fur006_50320 [Coleofasciculaceae cyanobacterium]
MGRFLGVIVSEVLSDRALTPTELLLAPTARAEEAAITIATELAAKTKYFFIMTSVFLLSKTMKEYIHPEAMKS